MILSESTFSIPLKFITVSEFIKSISEFTIDDGHHKSFVQQIDACADFGAEKEEGTHYTRKMFITTQKPTDLALLADALSQIPLFNYFKSTEQDLIEKAVVDSLQNFGNPTVAIKLDNGATLVTNPEDFAIYTDKDGQYLAALRPNVSILYTVLDVTEEEARKTAKELGFDFDLHTKN